MLYCKRHATLVSYFIFRETWEEINVKDNMYGGYKEPSISFQVRLEVQLQSDKDDLNKVHLTHLHAVQHSTEYM